MIASLPMYDRPEAQAANDRLWSLVRKAYNGPLPEHLTRDGSVWDHWTNPGLALSQTCGMPYRRQLHGKVSLVATPVFDLDCAPGHYVSVCLVRNGETCKRLEDFADACLAVNEPLSQSGWAAPENLARDMGFRFTNIVLTGAHSGSAEAVADGRADLAAVDAVTWSMIRRFDAFANDLRVLMETPPTPALPYITALGGDAPGLAAALDTAIQALPDTDRTLLCLKGVTQIPAEAYLAVPSPDCPRPLSN